MPSLKDSFISFIGKLVITRYISPYGQMTSLHIDTHNKTISVSADLRGESTPIEVELAYERLEENGIQVVKITAVKVSREWMSDIANSMLREYPQEFPIPQGVASIAARIFNI